MKKAIYQRVLTARRGSAVEFADCSCDDSFTFAIELSRLMLGNGR